MALLIDKRTSELSDWMNYDSKLTALLDDTHADIFGKSRLAQEILESELLELLIVHFQESPSAARSHLRRIVVGPELRRWHAFKTLELFYSDLAAVAVNPAHAEQAKKFLLLADQAKRHLLANGIGYVNNPLPAPDVPSLQSVESPGIPRVLRACIAFVSTAGELSGASKIFVLDISDSHSVRIGPVKLRPGASGWNLYIGAEENLLKLANESPLGDNETITVTAELPHANAPVAPQFGQEAQFFWLADRAIWR
jgi:hypothetical protein